MIECVKFKAYNNNTLQGFADLHIPNWGIEIRGCTLHKKGENYWINLPCKEDTINGEKKYFPIIKFYDKDRFQKFLEQALEVVLAFMNQEDQTKEDPEICF